MHFMNADSIKHLARLSRITVPEEQVAVFQKEFEEILSFVGQVKEAAGGESKAPVPEWRNIMREDASPNEPGVYTEKLLNNAPESEKTIDGGYVVVKKIL